MSNSEVNVSLNAVETKEQITDDNEKEVLRTDQEGVEVKLSKNQLKKKRKWERAMELKRKKKSQEKEARHALAKAQGRDLEKEIIILEQRTKAGDGRKRRQEKWETEKLPLIKKSFQVCLDCSFEDLMTEKEINSLASQIRYCYADNKRSPHPCMLSIASLKGRTLAKVENVAGFEEWGQRAFSHSHLAFEELFQEKLQNVVYLTSDSENTIQDLDDSKIYVIGGIVDRNRLKRAAISRAEKAGVATAKLPLDKHLQSMQSTKVLTCNHVFEILVKYRELGRDWGKALLAVLPHRKEAKPMTVNENDTDPAIS